MKKLLIAIIIISSLFSQSLTKGWYNDDFEVPDKLTTDDLEVLGGVPGVGKVLTDNGAGTGIAVWTTHSGANTALSNLASVAINTGLLLGASDGGALGSATKMWSDLFLASGGVINFNAGDLTLTHSANLLTLGGGDLQLGANNLGLTGSFGLTGSRILKGWFTDLECTNSITIGGTALSALYQPLDGALTNLSGLVYVSPSFIKMTANDTYAVRTLAEALSDLSGIASGAFSFNDQNVTNVGQIDVDIIDSDGASIQIGTGTNKITLTDNTSIDFTLGVDAGDDFTIDGTGFVYKGDNNRVGIGIASPSSPFEVFGTTVPQARISYDGDRYIALSNSGMAGNALTTQNNGLVISMLGGNTALTNGGDIIFKTGESALTEKMRIEQGGNVGIGTDSPASILEVNGGVNIGGTGAIGDNNLSVEGNLTVIGTTINMVTSGTVLTVGVGVDNGEVSAGIFTDRTPFYDGDALSKIKLIKGKNGQIDHESLPIFVQSHRVKDIFEKQPKKDEFNEFVLDSLGNQILEDVKVGEEKYIERNIGNQISVNVKALQQLIAINEDLTKRIEILEKP